MTAGRRRVAAVLIGTALLIAVVPPLVTVNRLKRRLEAAASAELGRKVRLGDVSVRLLPYPGFDINDVVIADDPAFSAEPMLTAESVTVRLRPSSLWSGRIEFSRFSFDNPSLNLVRDENGRWNVESLLQRTASTATAPTGAARTAAPRFPYIEVTNGRINFKHGAEKLAFSLLESDLALWLDSESKWKVRIETRPTRTDQYLSDTGTLRAEGSFARAPAQALGQVPFQLEADMERGQLGQLTSLLTGEDRGWRGDLRLTLSLDGKLDDLTIKADARFSGMRRYDIVTGPGFRADLHCTSHMVRTAPLARELREIECAIPAANGRIALSGRCAVPDITDYDLWLRVQDLPAATLADFYRHAKRSVAADLVTEGLVNGNWHFDSVAGPSGTGQVEGLTLSSDSRKGLLHIGTVPVSVLQIKHNIARRDRAQTNTMQLGPAAVDLGGGQPVKLAGGLSLNGLHLDIQGIAEASRLQAAAEMLGLAASHIDAQGPLDLALGLEVTWKEFKPAAVTGKVRWKGLRVAIPDTESFMQSPVGVLTLSATTYTLKPFTAYLDKSVTGLEGEFTLPRACEFPPCEARFEVKIDTLDLPALAAIFTPRDRPSGWFSLSAPNLGSQTPRPWLLDRRVSGSLVVQKLNVPSLNATKMAGTVRLTDRKIALTGLRGDLLGGRYSGSWTVDLTSDEPVISGDSHVENVPAAMLSPWLKTNKATGILKGDLHLKMSGANRAPFARTAQGELGFEWKDGSLSRIAMEGNLLRFTNMAGNVRFRDSIGSIQDAELRTLGSTYRINGELSFDGALDLRLTSAAGEYAVRGNLDTPVVENTGKPPSVASEVAPGRVRKN